VFARAPFLSRDWIELCHHKAFRRLDIQISSIGAGRWRGALPYSGTDGRERAEALDKYLNPIEEWIKCSEALGSRQDEELAKRIHEYLGECDDQKLFLASLLVSLLRPQQIAAKNRAEKRAARAS